LSQEYVQKAVWDLLVTLSAEKQCMVLSGVFDMFLKRSAGLSHVPDGFIQLAISGMNHLKECGRSNVIYSLVKSLGTMRPDQSDSLLPAKRMPMGLIEHCVNFFCATSINKVSVIICQ